MLSIQTAQIWGPRRLLLTAYKGESGWGIELINHLPWSYTSVPSTYHPGVHMDITVYRDCRLPLTKAVSCNVFFTTNLAQKHTYNEQLSTVIYAGTIWVIYTDPASNKYCHVTFMYKTCGKVNTHSEATVVHVHTIKVYGIMEGLLHSLQN